MPGVNHVVLSKGEVMMFLALAELNRSAAAKIAGVSRSTFFRLMSKHRVQAPKPQARLNRQQVEKIRTLSGKLTNKQLAKIYAVHQRTIERVLCCETWR